MRVELRQLESAPLAVIGRQVKQAEIARVVRECCGTVWNEMRAQQVKAGRHVAIYWDNSIRIEVGVEVFGPFTDKGEVVHSATPAGAIVTATHFGPYGGLGAAHRAIREWSNANHRALAGPNWEIYGHWLPEWNSDPSQIRTDVFYQLAP